MLWFKRKKIIRAKAAGLVEKVMYDYIIVGGRRYDTKKPLVEIGTKVIKGQPIGKRE